MPKLFDKLYVIWTEVMCVKEKTMWFEQKILPFITNEIFKRIRNKINHRTIFSEECFDYFNRDIEFSIKVLKSWLLNFDRTSRTIGLSNFERWDFQNKRQILDIPKHMILVLEDL